MSKEFNGPIFVYGANETFLSKAGSAKYAVNNYGAQIGKGPFLNQSYGIPTRYVSFGEGIISCSLNKVKSHVKDFIKFAEDNPDKNFMMTKIGCGLAGFREEEIYPLFENAPNNVDLPMDWCEIMGREMVNFIKYRRLYPIDSISMDKYNLLSIPKGFSLQIPGQKSKNYIFDKSKSRIQNIHEALKKSRKIDYSITYNPEEDGITHINVYSQGKTELGRFLSNFALSPINTPEGLFNSVEGYWYYLCSDAQEKEDLKTLWGFNAKKRGKELTAQDSRKDPEFIKKITKSIQNKITSNSRFQSELINCNLPIVHYYNYSGNIKTPFEYLWITDYIYNVRQKLKVYNNA